MEQNNDIFRTLYNVDISPYVTIGDFGFGPCPYLEWSVAWRLLKQHYPQAESMIHTCSGFGYPYFKDDTVGVLVHVSIKVDDMITSDWYPVKRGDGGDFTTKDITDAHQRALVKVCGRMGLGLELWENPQKFLTIPVSSQNILIETAKTVGWKGDEVRDLFKRFGYETITAVSQIRMGDYEKILAAIKE